MWITRASSHQVSATWRKGGPASEAIMRDDDLKNLCEDAFRQQVAALNDYDRLLKIRMAEFARKVEREVDEVFEASPAGGGRRDSMDRRNVSRSACTVKAASGPSPVRPALVLVRGTAVGTTAPAAPERLSGSLQPPKPPPRAGGAIRGNAAVEELAL